MRFKLKWVGLALLILPALFIVRAAIYVFSFHSDALPEIFWWLAIAMGLLALFAGFQTLRNMFSASSSPDSLPTSLPERAALLDEKNALLRAIKDISFEHDVGKLSDEEFQRLDHSYRARAKEVLRKLDEDLAPYLQRAEKIVTEHVNVSAGPMRTPQKPVHQSKKPKQKKKKRAQQVPPTKELIEGDQPRQICTSCGAQNELGAQDCSACGARIAALVCPKCEAKNDPDATFCKKCATKLTAEAST